jgi:hypothetical protein
MLNRLLQEKSEDKKDDTFQDQGDLFTIKLPPHEKIQWEDFSKVSLDELTCYVIYKGMNCLLGEKKLGQSVRYGSSIFMRTDIFPVVNYLVALPSLPANSSENDLCEMQKLFGKGFVVKGRSNQARGLIHLAIKTFFTKDNSLEENPRGKNLREKKSLANSIIPFKSSRTLGLSFTLESCDSKDKGKGVIMTLVGRSTDQQFIFKLNPVAENCFLFDEFKMSDTGLFLKDKYTTTSHLKRSIPSQAMTRLASAINIQLQEQKERLVYPIQVKIEDADNGIMYNEKWNRIRNDKEGIAEHLENSIYVVCGTKGQRLEEKSNVKIISEILAQAKALDVQLNLYKIPTRHQKNIRALPPLLLAIRTGDIDVVKYLVDNGVKAVTKHYNSLSFAKGLGASQAMIDYFSELEEEARPVFFHSKPARRAA